MRRFWTVDVVMENLVIKLVGSGVIPSRALVSPRGKRAFMGGFVPTPEVVSPFYVKGLLILAYDDHTVGFPNIVRRIHCSSSWKTKTLFSFDQASQGSLDPFKLKCLGAHEYKD